MNTRLIAHLDFYIAIPKQNCSVLYHNVSGFIAGVLGVEIENVVILNILGNCAVRQHIPDGLI